MTGPTVLVTLLMILGWLPGLITIGKVIRGPVRVGHHRR